MTVDIKSLSSDMLVAAKQIQEETEKRHAIRESVLKAFGITSVRALPHERLQEFNETLAKQLAEGKEIDIKIDTDDDDDDDKKSDDDGDDKPAFAKKDDSDDDENAKSDDENAKSDDEGDEKPKKKLPFFMKKKGAVQEKTSHPLNKYIKESDDFLV